MISYSHIIISPIVAFVMASGWCSSAEAHRVNIFAYSDGNAIQMECAFSRSRKVKDGRVSIMDAQTGALLDEIRTDAEGMSRYCPPREFLASGHALRIILDAGAGHRAEWFMSVEDLASLTMKPHGLLDTAALGMSDRDQKQLPSAASGSVAQTGSKETAVTITHHRSENHVNSQVGFTEDEWNRLERVVENVVERRLAGLRRLVARQYDSGPTLRDIAGGLGWILAVFAAGVLLRDRNKRS